MLYINLECQIILITITQKILNFNNKLNSFWLNWDDENVCLKITYKFSCNRNQMLLSYMKISLFLSWKYVFINFKEFELKIKIKRDLH